MAKVKWQKRAEHELYRLLVKGYLEFGEATAKAFADKVASLNDHLSKIHYLCARQGHILLS